MRLPVYRILQIVTLLSVAIGPVKADVASVEPRGEDLGDRLWSLFNPELRRIDRERASLERTLTVLPPGAPAPRAVGGYRSEPAAHATAKKWVQVDLGREYPLDDIVLVPAFQPFGDHPGPGFGFPPGFCVEVANWEDFADARMVGDFTETPFPNPGLAPVVVDARGHQARFIRVTATRLWPRIDDWVFALSELVVVSGNRNVAGNQRVTASDSFEAGAWSRAALVDGWGAFGKPTADDDLPTNGYHSQVETAPGVEKWVQVDLLQSVALDRIRLIAARPVDFPDTIGFGFPLRFRIETATKPDFSDRIVVADHTEADFPNPGDRAVEFSVGGRLVRNIRVVATRLWERTGDYVFALGELQAMAGSANVARGKPVTGSDPLEENHWQPRFLVDGIAPTEGLGTYAQWLVRLAEREMIERRLAMLRSRRLSAQSVAQTRAMFTTGVVLAGLLLGSAWLVRRSRVRRRRELQELRDQIASDLHDEIGSNLSSIALLSQMALRQKSSEDNGELEEIERIARATSRAMREIVWLIRPGPNSTEELVTQMRNAAGNLLQGIAWEFRAGPLPEHMPLDFRRDLFLFAKEALHNAARHARPQSVWITIEESDGLIRLEVSDDGIGFHPSTVRSGRGLVSLRNRAESLGGKVEIISAPGEGTRVILTVSAASAATDVLV